jgi:type IX secretion system PorP/SprF family membrane protein
MARGQQLPHYTQFDQNRFLTDPAVAGTKPYYRVRLHARDQWSGLDGGPRTGVLSIQGPLRQNQSGIGGYFFKDEAGPAERTGGQLAYSYQFRVDEAKRLALGLGVGILQYRINRSELVLADPNDRAFQGDNMSSLMPDASFGAYFFGRKFGIGLSGFQLLHNRVDWQNTNTRLDGHYFLNGYYETALNKKLDLRPVLLVKHVVNTETQYEFGARVIYKEMLWAGLNYRTQDALAAALGYRFKDKWSVSYSYDMTLNGLRNYHSGTHELVLGYRFHPNFGGNDDKETNDD